MNVRLSDTPLSLPVRESDSIFAKPVTVVEEGTLLAVPVRLSDSHLAVPVRLTTGSLPLEPGDEPHVDPELLILSPLEGETFIEEAPAPDPDPGPGPDPDPQPAEAVTWTDINDTYPFSSMPVIGEMTPFNGKRAVFPDRVVQFGHVSQTESFAWQLEFDTGIWTELPLPDRVWLGAGLTVTDENGRILIAAVSGGATRLYWWTPGTTTTELAVTPSSVQLNLGSEAIRYGDDVFIGLNTTEPVRVNLNTGAATPLTAWSSLPEPGGPPSMNPPSIAHDVTSKYVYAWSERNFGRYDLDTDTWETLQDHPLPGIFVVRAVHNGLPVVAGGWDLATMEGSAATWLFRDGQWVQTDDAPAPVVNMSTVQSGSRVFSLYNPESFIDPTAARNSFLMEWE